MLKCLIVEKIILIVLRYKFDQNLISHKKVHINVAYLSFMMFDSLLPTITGGGGSLITLILLWFADYYVEIIEAVIDNCTKVL